jgi:hypothetical protein
LIGFRESLLDTLVLREGGSLTQLIKLAKRKILKIFTITIYPLLRNVRERRGAEKNNVFYI